MPGRVQRAGQLVPHLPIGLVLALALLVLHHAALFVERGLVDRTEQVTHAVRFHPQRHVQRGGGHVLEVIGAVGVGGAILVGGADLLERLEELAAVVLAALEHQVLEQVGEAGAPGRLVLGTDVVPDVDRHDRRLAVGVHHHAQAVGQGEFLERNVHRGGRGRGLGSGRQWHAGEPAQGEAQRGGEKGGPGSCCVHPAFLEQ